MRASCEIIVKTFLPAMRADIAKGLSERGYTQTQIAEFLGLTQAAVSKYLGGRLYPEVKTMSEQPEVLDTAHRIVEGLTSKAFDQMGAISEMCTCCRAMRNSHKLCAYHEGMLPGISKSCNLCADRPRA